MKTIFFFLVFIIGIKMFAQGYEEDLIEANRIFKNGDENTAKELYLKAAKKGSSEAHFKLAYNYILSDEEDLYHLKQAAIKGHNKALSYALEKLLFRANSLKKANPKEALEIYYKAKKANPKLRLYDEENKLKIMKMCAEVKDFDVEGFIKKYNIKDEDGNFPFYDVWELAEEASIDGRFGKPNPELVFNLVIRGAWVPAELEYAVLDTYKNWKKGIVEEFNICNYVTSGSGMGYCASREEKKEDKKRDIKLANLEKELDKETKKKLYTTYSLAVKFIELKAREEEIHGGTGRAAWIIESINRQKDEYIKLIEKIQNGYTPSLEKSFNKVDSELNSVYKRVIKKLKNSDLYELPKVSDLRKVQRSWIDYRDFTVDLFFDINSKLDKDTLKSWLTINRIEELKMILEYK